MSHWTEGKTNLAQSVLVQLRNFARETGEDPQVIQLRYATERLMYRISRSAYADRFVLKGAWLFFLWGDPQRATRDVDFAGHFANSEAEVGTIFREILGADVDVDDAIDFDPDSLEFIQTQEGENTAASRSESRGGWAAPDFGPRSTSASAMSWLKPRSRQSCPRSSTCPAREC